jgi:stress response protein SCP2
MPTATRRLARFDLSEDSSTETAMIFGEIYRAGSEWKFKAVGQGFSGGLGTTGALVRNQRLIGGACMPVLAKGPTPEDLRDLIPTGNFRVGLAVHGLTVDFACFGLDTAGKLADERYMTFFNQPRSPCNGG